MDYDAYEEWNDKWLSTVHIIFYKIEAESTRR